ncbi:MAG TPA: hypothetical protein VFU89_03390 [Rhabdochlamydiaceae bacterium]|nr:hypothetical protein [Rhabdochlamydiaceae bacterium]
MSNILTGILNFCGRWYPAAIRTIEYGTVIYYGYESVEKYQEIANQAGAATPRQKVSLVFSLTNLTSSVLTLAYQPESVIQKSSQDNEKCNRGMKRIYDIVEYHIDAGIGEDQAVLREGLKDCGTCIVQSASQYRLSNWILLTIQMASLLMSFGSRHFENAPILGNRRFTISISMQMVVIVDLLSKIFSDSALKPQKYLASACRPMKFLKWPAGIYLKMVLMQNFLRSRKLQSCVIL